MSNIYNAMFGDIGTFITFFENHDSKENRDALLKSSMLCYWYCVHIKDRVDIRRRITDKAYRQHYEWWRVRETRRNMEDLEKDALERGIRTHEFKARMRDDSYRRQMRQKFKRRNNT